MRRKARPHSLSYYSRPANEHSGEHSQLALPSSSLLSPLPRSNSALTLALASGSGSGSRGPIGRFQTATAHTTNPQLETAAAETPRRLNALLPLRVVVRPPHPVLPCRARRGGETTTRRQTRIIHCPQSALSRPLIAQIPYFRGLYLSEKTVLAAPRCWPSPPPLLLLHSQPVKTRASLRPAQWHH